MTFFKTKIVRNKTKMIVIVYLQDPKKYIAVPESFVYDLDERSLKNRGVNRNQNRLVYFSQEWHENMEANENVLQEFEPNFHCAITTRYPLPNYLDETCFIGRLISFEGNNCNKNIDIFYSISNSMFDVFLT